MRIGTTKPFINQTCVGILNELFLFYSSMIEGKRINVAVNLVPCETLDTMAWFSILVFLKYRKIRHGILRQGKARNNKKLP